MFTELDHLRVSVEGGGGGGAVGGGVARELHVTDVGLRESLSSSELDDLQHILRDNRMIIKHLHVIYHGSHKHQQNNLYAATRIANARIRITDWYHSHFSDKMLRKHNLRELM